MKVYVHHEGDKLGPLAVEEVRALLEQGKLSPDTDAWVDGSEDWIPLADVPGLKRVVKAQAKKVSSDRQSVEPMASVKGDLKNLKSNTSATAGELRQFLNEMRGQTPKEMLGTIAQSDLVRSVTISAASICGLLLAMSVIAYGIRDEEAANPKKKDADKSPAKAATPNPATPPPATAQPGTPPDPLGVNQEKKGTPKESNPFDTEGDLLKDK